MSGLQVGESSAYGTLSAAAQLTQPPQPLFASQASMSTQSTRISFAVAKDYKPTPIKFDNVERLESRSNYEDWASQIAFVLDTHECSRDSH